MSVFQDEIKKEFAELHGSVEGNAVTFYYRNVRDKKKSKEAGRDIFVDKPYVTIRSPGQSKQIVDREVDKDLLLYWQTKKSIIARQEYLNLWERFKTLDHKVVEGLPIQEWTEITKSTAHALIAAGIESVEALSTVADHLIGPGKPVSNDLREKARRFLKMDGERAMAADVVAKEKKIIDLEARTKEQEAALSGLLARLKYLEEKHESVDHLSGRSAGDGGDGAERNSRQQRPDGGADSSARKAKPARGGAEASVADPS